MLKSYEVTNFKSFKNWTKFDLEKTNYQTLAGTNVYGNVLKGLMFVGSNASGKTNAILAIKFLLDCLFGKNEVNIDSYVCLFSQELFMNLKYQFEIDGVDVVYEISYQKIDKVLKEIVMVDDKRVFMRDGSVAEVEISDRSRHTDVPKNMLFLRDVYFHTKFRGHEILQKWFSFLSNSVYLDLYERSVVQYGGINLSLESYMEEDGVNRTNAFFSEHNFNQSVEYDKKSIGRMNTIESPEKEIYFKRKGIDEPIPFGLESLGNKNLVALLPSVFHCIEKKGMLLLDEFSSGFHNELEQLLIRYFMNKANGSQLIFVSHSTNLLSNSIMRPDQIYSVDFMEDGSVIKRFSSEKPREAQNLEKMYLGGVFNGIPKYEHLHK